MLDQPLLTLYTKHSDSAESLGLFNQEMTATNTKSNPNNKCSRQRLTIDFADLGWNSVIIEPKYLQSYFCGGSCDLPLDGQVSNKHAILQALAKRHSQANYGFLPSTCCTPSKYTSNLFLVLDENDQMVVKKLEDVVVQACACQ